MNVTLVPLVGLILVAAQADGQEYPPLDAAVQQNGRSACSR